MTWEGFKLGGSAMVDNENVGWADSDEDDTVEQIEMPEPVRPVLMEFVLI